MNLHFALCLTAITAMAPLTRAQTVSLDPGLPSYVPTSGVSGSLISVGSDTLNNLMTFWAEGFQAIYPNISVQIEGKGSSTAPPALTEGTAQMGPMSRAMKQEEQDAFEKRFGYKPTEIRVAIDALTIFAHKDNPVPGLTLKQADAIFSATRKRGEPQNITQWSQVGLHGWSGRPISLYGRNSASGTYGFFKESVLGKGDFKSTVKEQPGSSAVVQGVASDEFSLGYSGIGYLTSGVRALPLGETDSTLAVASYENCLNGSYPLARFVLIYINKAPGKPLDTTIHEFLRFILSRQGQERVLKDGYYPLPADLSASVVSSLTHDSSSPPRSSPPVNQ